ncbi:MAG: tetratricopeptide repeat protein [Ignavibacteriales bacterium]|nr:tetratricopeptide repeat protein [Ignavibacteriales bacterium]MCB9209699.1 tetratricopeptide repeat protein [Ignavibacteriales bacterium]MCB9218855.1 tetratricopeptide repeat protein [Ignavibacteriales bacterium]
MNLLKKILFLTLFVTFTISAGQNSFRVVADSLDASKVMVEASLFFEAYKNKQYEMWTIEKGFNVINNDPNFQNNKYTIYRKIDKVIFEVYHDSSTTDEVKAVLADTALYLYDLGIKYDQEYAGTYMVKKGYVLNEWKSAPVEESIAAYEEGFASGLEVINEVYYLDKLGSLYKENMNDDNDYKMKALDIYLKLSDLEPDNARWANEVTQLAEDEQQLKEFMQKAWYADKENTEKAWKYARACKKVDDYESALEPLKFLIEKNPEVINYWNEIARAYQKNDQTDKAVESYKELINLQPDNRDSYFNLALLYKDMGQLSVARSYLQKAAKVSPGWDYPLYIEAGLYEQAARDCGFEFEDKCVYQLAVDTYRQVSRMGGEHASQAADRVNALSNSVPTKEDFFFRKLKDGDVIKIEGKCYDWIGKSITVSL